jgi:hypothetical protein
MTASGQARFLWVQCMAHTQARFPDKRRRPLTLHTMQLWWTLAKGPPQLLVGNSGTVACVLRRLVISASAEEPTPAIAQSIVQALLRSDLQTHGAPRGSTLVALDSTRPHPHLSASTWESLARVLGGPHVRAASGTLQTLLMSVLVTGVHSVSWARGVIAQTVRCKESMLFLHGMMQEGDGTKALFARALLAAPLLHGGDDCSPSLPKTTIMALLPEPYVPDDRTAAGMAPCIVCKDPPDATSTWLLMPCGCALHELCFMAWADTSNSFWDSPLCLACQSRMVPLLARASGNVAVK